MVSPTLQQLNEVLEMRGCEFYLEIQMCYSVHYRIHIRSSSASNLSMITVKTSTVNFCWQVFVIPTPGSDDSSCFVFIICLFVFFTPSPVVCKSEGAGTQSADESGGMRGRVHNTCRKRCWKHATHANAHMLCCGAYASLNFNDLHGKNVMAIF